MVMQILIGLHVRFSFVLSNTKKDRAAHEVRSHNYHLVADAARLRPSPVRERSES